MADADRSAHTRQTRIDAGLPRAPRLGSLASSVGTGAGRSGVTGSARQGLGTSQVHGREPGLGRVESDQSLGNSTIRSDRTGVGIPPAPPLGTIRMGSSEQGGASGGTSGRVRGSGGKTRAQMLFDAIEDTPDSEIERETGIILPRDERGRPGTNDYKKNREAATSSIDNKFGISRHFLST